MSFNIPDIGSVVTILPFVMEYFAVQLRIAEIPEYFLQKPKIGPMLVIELYHSKGQIVFITAYCLQPRPVVKLLCGKY